MRPTCWEEEAAGRKEERADALGSELGEPDNRRGEMIKEKMCSHKIKEQMK